MIGFTAEYASGEIAIDPQELEIARLVGVSRDTVSHWFSSGAGSRTAPEQHCRRLATIDFAWWNLERLPQQILDEWCNLSEN